MSAHSREGSDRSERSDIQLPYIGRSGLSIWDDKSGRRTGSPLVQDRPSVPDDWLNSQSGFGNHTQKDIPFYPRPPPIDPHDELRMCKENLAKKERLIAQLTSIETPRPKAFDSSKIDEFYSNEHMVACANAKSDVAVLQVKAEGLQSQLRDALNQIDVREEKLREMHLALEASKESEAKHVALVQSLRDKLIEYETQMSILEGNASRSELAIKTLTLENEMNQRHILELEGLLRSKLDDRQTVKSNKADHQLNNVIYQLSSLLPESEEASLSSSPERAVNLVKDLKREVIEARSKLSAAESLVRGLESEQKANRETIIRMAAEAEKEKHLTLHNNSELQAIKRESDESKMRVKDLEHQLRIVNERCEAAEREIDDHRKQNGIRQETELKQKSLREFLVPLLIDGSDIAELDEDDIRERVQNLLMIVRDKTIKIEMLQKKLSELVAELDQSRERANSAELERDRVQPGIRDAEHRLRKAMDELAAGEVLRDELRADKEKFLKFLETLSVTLSMNAISADMGIDGATGAILARAEQIMKNESLAMVDRKTQVYSLQRQIKTLKEQNDSKDLHMDLLRKKVTALEERLTGKSEVEREKDNEFVKNRKLVKLVEKYKCELNEAHVEIRDLKARLLRTTEIQNKSLQSERRIEELESVIAKLEELQHKQTDKIGSLQDIMKSSNHQTAKKDEIASNTIQALTSELRTTKQSLDETTKREHQLLELRQVISRMLGLDVNSLAVPDYELIARLEKLILANQANATTALVLDSAIADLGQGFHAGYQDAARSLAIATRSFNSPYRQSVGIRSASPQRRYENSAY